MANPCSIRFPEGLRDRIAARAAAERRTFSNQVVVLLENALAGALPPSERAVPDALRRQFDAHEVEP